MGSFATPVSCTRVGYVGAQRPVASTLTPAPNAALDSADDEGRVDVHVAVARRDAREDGGRRRATGRVVVLADPDRLLGERLPIVRLAVVGPRARPRDLVADAAAADLERRRGGRHVATSEAPRERHVPTR